MADTTFRQSIYDLLTHWRGLESLKDLFWSQLNYDRVNQTIARSGWPKAASEALADQPLVFAEAGDSGQFKVLYARLASDRLRLTDERAVVNRLLREYPYALFIFSDKDQKRWHLVNVKDAPRLALTPGPSPLEREEHAPRLLFRRIALGPEERVRTAAERLGLLDTATIQRELRQGLSPLQIQKRHDEAFDVEKVTKEFFVIYRRIFEEAEATLPAVISAEDKRLYTQRFFNRLMFLAFLERKGWMTFNGHTDYLQALFDDYWRNDPDKRREANFHRKRLNALFFLALNNRYEANVLQQKDYDLFRALVGEAPYLNGGLFEKEGDDEKWFFPDAVVAKILAELIYHFNFTVTESTPLDVEVAVDPEMLGKIFEELVTGRHETGSYYTPKPVVAFMCREALKHYLRDDLAKESTAAIALLVEEHNASGLRNPEAALESLRRVRACDPACGSGAYLLGLLHELLDLRACLFVARQLDAGTVYDHKLEIIQNNVYGVDLDPFAVNIARLRLWLSLVVDDTRNPLEDPAIDVSLPNLNYKIEAGDSLTAPDPSGGLEMGFRRQLVDELLEAKQKYLTAHDTQKIALREIIEAKRAEIITWAGRNTGQSDQSPHTFDWAIEFAEIFVAPTPTTTLSGAMAGLVNTTAGQMEFATPPPAEIGFDIVLANPPYVRADAQFKHIADEQERQKEVAKWQAFRKQLKNAKIYKTLHEKWDLYVPFLERAYQLLQPGGQMVFILPDAYNAAKYAGKSHEFFLQNSRVERIDFCSEIDLFDAGVNNTILHFAKAAPPAEHKPVRVRRWGKRDEFDDNQQTLATLAQIEYGMSLFRIDGTKTEIVEGHVTLEKICYISKGMVIHANEQKAHLAFRAADLISETEDKSHPKPFVEGKDLIKWVPNRIRYLEYGTKRAPSLFSRPTFPQLYEVQEKLISMDLAGGEPKVAYDNNQLFHNHSAWSFVPWHLLKDVVNNSIKKTAKYRHQNPLGDREAREKTSKQFNLKYVLAVMNSSYAREWLKGKRRSKMHIYPDDWKQLPIAPIPLEEQKPLVALVNNILREYEKHGYPLPPASTQKVSAWERELDEMVGRLYGAG
jgi:methylase of polypeptide subunit release factors